MSEDQEISPPGTFYKERENPIRSKEDLRTPTLNTSGVILDIKKEIENASEKKQENLVKIYLDQLKRFEGYNSDFPQDISSLELFLREKIENPETTSEEKLRLSLDLKSIEARRNKVTGWTDPLTGLYNRRGFLQKLKEIIAFPEYHFEKPEQVIGQSVSIMMTDIDNFGELNKLYGHDLGDKALNVFAKELISATRLSDMIVRIGGEEVAILIFGADENEALIKDAEFTGRLQRREITKNKNGEPVNLDYSAGIQTNTWIELSGIAREADESKLSEFLSTADSRMHKSKEKGKGITSAE